MKKTILKNIIKGILLEERGYSNYSDSGTTDGLTKGTLDKILLKISKGNEDEDQVARGNKILDKADPENIARILRGELPEYEEVDRMQELAGIQSEVKVKNPIPVKFEDLEKDKVYNFIYSLDYLDNGREQNDNLEVGEKDSIHGENFIIVKPKGDGWEHSFELYPEDIISIKRI